MRKLYVPILLLLLSSVLILTSCSTKKSILVDEYIPETDFPYHFLSDQDKLGVARSDQGYYILNANYIYFMEPGSESPVILDSRPDHECLERNDGENCNAYVEMEYHYIPTFIQFYDNKLYVIEYSETSKASSNDSPLTPMAYKLVRRDADGSNRKELHTFDHAQIWSAAIHRDYLYYVAEDQDKDNNEEYKIGRLALNNLSKESEILYEGEYEKGRITNMFPYGSYLYFNEQEPFEDSQFKRYDLNEATVSPVWETSGEKQRFLLTIHNNEFYFGYYYGTNDEEPDEEYSDTFDERHLKIYTSDLDGNNIQDTSVEAAEIVSNVYKDNHYTYTKPVAFQVRALEDADIHVRNAMEIHQEDQLIHTVDTSEFSNGHDLIPGDDRYMFITESYSSEDSNYRIYELYYLDKNEIESGEAQFKKLLETPIYTGLQMR